MKVLFDLVVGLLSAIADGITILKEVPTKKRIILIIGSAVIVLAIAITLIITLSKPKR